MEIEDRLAKLLRCARNGRLPVYYTASNGKQYEMDWDDIRSELLCDLLYGLDSNSFTYDGEVI